MRTIRASLIPALVLTCMPLYAQGPKPAETRTPQRDRDGAQTGASWTRALKVPAKRGTLHDAFQNVRGDSGKWNDKPILQHAPPIGQKPVKMPLDDWADQLLKREFRLTPNDDNWLLFRTRQLDDNDRVWVERIERRGNQFTVIVHQAIWQGRYSKTFTYYSVFGVNLGKLEPGDYEAKWIIKPLLFSQFDGDGRPNENWPRGERAADDKPSELHVTFGVLAEAP